MKEKKQQQSSKGRGKEGGTGHSQHMFSRLPTKSQAKLNRSQSCRCQSSRLICRLAICGSHSHSSPRPPPSLSSSFSLLVYVCKIKLFKFNYCQFYLLLMRIIVKFAKFMNAVKETERQTGTATC